MVKMRVKAMPGTKGSTGEFEMYEGGVMTELLAFQMKSNKNDMEEIENLQKRMSWTALIRMICIDYISVSERPNKWKSFTAESGASAT